METSDYLEKAHHNEDFLGTVDKDIFADWYVTACFYVALHYVNAFISVHLKSGFCSHEKVKNVLNPNGAFPVLRAPKNIYQDYLELQNLSRKARYMQVGDNEKSVCKFMKPKHAALASGLMDSVRTFMLAKVVKDTKP